MMCYKFSFLLILLCKFTHSLIISQCCGDSGGECEPKFPKCTDFGCSFMDDDKTEGIASIYLTSCSSVGNSEDGPNGNYNFTFVTSDDANMELDALAASTLSVDRNTFCFEGKQKLDEFDFQNTTDWVVRICKPDDASTTPASVDVDVDVDVEVGDENADSGRIQDDAEMSEAMRLAYVILTITAATFACLTIMSFLLVYDKLDIHGWTQCTHSFAFFLLLLSWLGSETITVEIGTPLCKELAIFNHFIYVSVYAWLVVVNFDLMKAFWIQRHKSRIPKCWPIYIKYCMFGWGIPGAIVLTSIGIELTIGSAEGVVTTDGMNYMLPNYGEIKDAPCSVDYISWPYVLLPNGIFFLLVILIILNTVRVVLAHPQWFRTQSKRHNQGKVLIWKILLTMGMFWFTDVFSLFYISIYGFHDWLNIMDFFVLFQAIPFFVIYVCRPESLLNLSDKYPKSRKLVLCLARWFDVDMQRPDPVVEMKRPAPGGSRTHK